ncbi:hypothetical protein IAQ61_008221 [Plenodomus lingam]|uniref:uncharacterized protein n=1 Tax=Leptosphaeria maculans TaxID=5022 RepID=UPI003328B64B|nr:hypothetical protein IAQ61_008221 [Plenodomus lingam]
MAQTVSRHPQGPLGIHMARENDGLSEKQKRDFHRLVGRNSDALSTKNVLLLLPTPPCDEVEGDGFRDKYNKVGPEEGRGPCKPARPHARCMLPAVAAEYLWAMPPTALFQHSSSTCPALVQHPSPWRLEAGAGWLGWQSLSLLAMLGGLQAPASPPLSTVVRGPTYAAATSLLRGLSRLSTSSSPWSTVKYVLS